MDIAGQPLTAARDAAAYARLDPGPALCALRGRALAGLAQALGAGGERPDVAPILPWCAADSPRPSRALDRWQAAHLATDPRPGDAVLQAVLAGTVPPGWMTRLRDRLRRPAPVPLAGQARFLMPLAGLAFAEAGFRLAAAGLLREHLAARVILHPGPAALPPLSPVLCLALAVDWTAGDPGNRRLALAAGRLAAATPGWAGFTEQWLVRAAARLGGWPGGLRDLPVAARGRAALVETDHDDPGACPAGWRATAPGWATPLLSGTP